MSLLFPFLVREKEIGYCKVGKNVGICILFSSFADQMNNFKIILFYSNIMVILFYMPILSVDEMNNVKEMQDSWVIDLFDNSIIYADLVSTYIAV